MSCAIFFDSLPHAWRGVFLVQKWEALGKSASSACQKVCDKQVSGEQVLPPWPSLPDLAKILRIPIAKFAKKRCFFRKISFVAACALPITIAARNGCDPLALSRFLRQEGQPDGRNARSVFWMPARQARPEIAGEPDVSLSRFCLPGWEAILLPQTSRWYESPRRSSDGRRHRSWRRCAAS